MSYFRAPQGFYVNFYTGERKQLYEIVRVRDRQTNEILQAMIVDGDESGVILRLIQRKEEIDLRPQFDDNKRYKILPKEVKNV